MGNFYLFTGPEAGQKNDEIADLKQKAREKYGTIEEYSYYASETPIGDIVSQLLNGSLFTPSIFVVVKNAEVIKATEEKFISKWAASCNSSSNTLVLVSDENKINTKIESLVPSVNKKIFWEMFENRKQDWVKDYFRKNGMGIISDAVDAILEMLENNTETLKNECSRFFYCFESGHTVSEEDVEKILSHNKEETAFSLFDAMCALGEPAQKRFESSLAILDKIMSSSNSSKAIPTIAGLVYCFRQLRAWHFLHSKTDKPSEDDYKKNGFARKQSRTQYQNAARVWGAGSTASIIALLSSTDIELRSNMAAHEKTIMSLLIYSIVMKNGAYCSSYDKY